MSCDGAINPLWETLKLAIAEGYGTPFFREKLSLRIADLDKPSAESPCRIEQMKTEVILLFEITTGLNLRTIELCGTTTTGT